MPLDSSLRLGLAYALACAACSPATEEAPARSASAAGSGSVMQPASAAPDAAPLVPVVNAGATGTSALVGCGPGVYAGTYDTGLLGSGPLQFSLVASAEKPGLAGPCEEFCPEVVISADGGDFSGSWAGIEARAKVAGGLDCRTGEFRAQLVDGYWGMDPKDPNTLPFLTGTLMGTFKGTFKAGAAPSIEGMFMTMTSVAGEGTFRLMLSQP